MRDQIQKRQLPVIQEANQRCYESIEKRDAACLKKNCKQWIDFPNGRNCVLVTTQKGPLTLNEIGQIYGLTRMRICQIEKKIYQKIRNFIQE